jgi:hypothetical protein
MQRGEHDIEHELVFASHDGYVFHDSRGFEGGNKKELEIVQDFVFRKSREKRLKDRLHAIWFDSLTEYLPLQIYKIHCSGTAFRWTMTGRP